MSVYALDDGEYGFAHGGPPGVVAPTWALLLEGPRTAGQWLRYHGPMSASPYPKIELRVHLEATVRPERLLELGRRNDVRTAGPTPQEAWSASAASAAQAEASVVWVKTTSVLRHRVDFREIVVDYAGGSPPRAASTPSRCSRRPSRVWRGVSSERGSSGGTATAPMRRESGAASDFPLHAGHHAQLSAGGRREAGPSGPYASASGEWPASASAGVSIASLRRRSHAPSPSPAREASRPRPTLGRRPARPRSAPRWTTCTPTACGTACAPSRPGAARGTRGARRRLRRHAGEQPAHRRREVPQTSTLCRPCSPPESSVPSAATTRCSCRRRSRRMPASPCAWGTRREPCTSTRSRAPSATSRPAPVSRPRATLTTGRRLPST